MKIIITEQQYELITEAYKWKPSKAQKQAFAKKMEDPEEQAAYYKRKEDKLVKKRATSKFDYNTAGGYYVPTKEQHDFVMKNMDLFTTSEEIEAVNMVLNGYSLNEKIHHDYIHIVNEKRRKIS